MQPDPPDRRDPQAPLDQQGPLGPRVLPGLRVRLGSAGRLAPQASVVRLGPLVRKALQVNVARQASADRLVPRVPRVNAARRARLRLAEPLALAGHASGDALPTAAFTPPSNPYSATSL